MEASLIIIWIIASAVQLFYFLYFFARLAFYQPPSKSNPAPLPPVSVIIACHNEANNLPNLLSLLAEQHYPFFEVIIVNDRSTDGTGDIISQFVRQHKYFHSINIAQTPASFNPKKYALNMGIDAAQHPWLVFTDGDCLPTSQHWLSKLMENSHAPKEVILGIGRYMASNTWLSLWVKYETFYTAIQYLSFAVAGVPYMGVGRNLAYKKTLFLQKGGYAKHRATLGGDDDLTVSEIANAYNTTISLSPESQTVSEAPLTWSAWWHQKKRHLSVGQYYKLRHQALLGLLNLSHICFYILLIPLLLIDATFWYAIFIYGLRMLLLLGLYSKLGQKISYQQTVYLLPCLDGLYPIYYIAIGIASVSTKNIKWN